MNRITFNSLMSRLENDNATTIRMKFISGRRHFVSKDNMLATSLLDVVCTDKIMSVINNEDFGMILDSLFPKNFFEIRWLNRYLDLLVRTLDCEKTQAKVDSLCEQFSHEFQDRVQELRKNLVTIKDPDDSELWQSLIDIFKLATILRNHYHGKGISVYVTRQDMEFLEKALRDNRVAANIVQKIDTFRQDERQFAVLLSWFLIEMICDQDNIV